MNAQTLSSTTSSSERVDFVAVVSFLAVHAAAVIGVGCVGWSWRAAQLAALFYGVRMFGITAGFHRYFAHRAFKTSRPMQFVFALLATTSTQQGVLWWSSHHRMHHKRSDEVGDVHSRKQRGFFWAHIGWLLVTTYNETRWDEIKDFARYPELRWLNRLHLLPSIALAAGLFVWGGPSALVWGYFVSTCCLWHATFTLNSLAHSLGSQRYRTHDASTNHLGIALITMGEGWHNNHHHYPRSACHGFYWWEIDLTFYVLRGLAKLGLVWDLERVPAKVRNARVTDPAAPPTYRRPAQAT